MEVLNSFVKNGEFKEISSSISFGVSVVIKSNRVQWLMNISDHVDEISCEKCSFSSKFSKIGFKCGSGLLNSDDRGHCAFSVIDGWYGGIGDERTKFYNSFYVSTKCHSFQISILYCLPLRSSGQTADSMKVLVLLSQRLLMARVSSLKSTLVLGSS